MPSVPKPYAPTEADALWLARALAGEGAPTREVAQALVNRFLFLRMTRDRELYSTLGDFVQAYAQPINPRWMRGGSKWDAAFRDADAKGRHHLEALHERRLRHRRRTEFDREILEAVDVALTAGPVDLESATITDYAAHTHRAGPHLQLVRPGRPGVNALYREKDTRGWLGYSAHIVNRHTISQTWGHNLQADSPTDLQRLEVLMAFGTLELRGREDPGHPETV